MMLKRILLLTCACVTLQSNCGTGPSRNQAQQQMPAEIPIGLLVGPNGQVVGIAVSERALAMAALLSALPECGNCAGCIARRNAQAAAQQPQAQNAPSNLATVQAQEIHALAQNLSAVLARPASTNSSRSSTPKPGDQGKPADQAQ